MSKDPAFLFYPGDWQGGTATFTRHLKGCYMDVLIAQFNSGPLSLEEIKTVLGSDFGSSWPTIQKKFKKTSNGLFFNERLEAEKNKRAKFSESRRQNIKKRYQKATSEATYVEDMKLHMENENENRNGSFLKGGMGENFFPGETDVGKYTLPDLKIGSVIELFRITKQQTVSVEQVKGLFEIFKRQHFTGKRYYADESEVHSHFINWCKFQNVGNGNSKSNGGGGKSTYGKSAGAIELARSLADDLGITDLHGSGDPGG